MVRMGHWSARAGSVVLMTTLLLAPVAHAETQPVKEPWEQRLVGLNLLQGRTNKGLEIGEPLSRAEFAALIVRAFGQEAAAKDMKAAVPFPDVKNHWASGYIAAAERIAQYHGASLGLPDGKFRPDAAVTGPEVAAFLMKVTGVKPAPNVAWPENYVKAANALVGLQNQQLIREQGNRPVSRGVAFELADEAFYFHKLPEGGTVYTTYVDTIKPTLTIDSFKVDAANNQATVTGSVSADVDSVWVGSDGARAAVSRGRFTATVPWAAGAPAVRVVAFDLAGNSAETTAK